MSTLNRREFMSTSVLAGAGVLAANSIINAAMASDHKGHQHRERNKDLDKVVEKSLHCSKVGEQCISHCVDELAGGNADLKSCYVAVTNMVAVCRAMGTVANTQTASKENIASMAKTCIGFLEACAKECEKHAKTHEVCKACMEACNDCIKACKKVA